MKIYEIEAYPDATFWTDSRAQKQFTERMKRRDRWAMWLFLAMLANFVASGVAGILGFPILTAAGIAATFVMVVFGAVILLRLPSYECPQCQTRMRRVWNFISRGRSGEFLLCTSCKMALYTHRTLR